MKKKSSPLFFNSIFTFLILGILVVLNLLLSKNNFRFDSTQEKRYSLSKATQKILKNINDVVVLKLYISSDLPPALANVREDIRDTLAEYQNLSSYKISVQEIDPAKDPEEEKNINQLGIPPLQVSVVEKDARAVKKIYLGLGVFYEDKKEMFPVLSDAGNLEYQISSALLKLSSANLKKIGILLDDKELLSKRYSILKENLEKTYELVLFKADEDLDFSNLSSLLLLSPQNLSEKNKELIKNYYQQGGHLFVLANTVEISQELEAKPISNTLIPFLSGFGIQIEENLVLDASNAPAVFAMGGMQYQIPYPFWVKVNHEGLNDSQPITANLQSLVLPWTSSIQTNGQLDPKSKQIFMAQATPSSQIQKSPFVLQPQALEQSPLQAQGTAGLVSLTQKENSVLLVIGSTRFIEDDFLRMFEDNLSFFLNATDWMSLGEELIQIRSKTLVDRPLKLLSENDKNWIKTLNTYGVAFLIILLGLFYNYLRHKKLKALQALAE